MGARDARPGADDVYRPAIVVGDSRTGETQKFDGPYYMLRTIALSVSRHTPIAQFGASSAPFNVVPVDFVVDALPGCQASRAQSVRRSTWSTRSRSARASCSRLSSKEYAGKEPGYQVPPRLVENSLRLKPVRDMFSGAPQQSILYLNHAVRFDTRRADELLARGGLAARASRSTSARSSLLPRARGRPGLRARSASSSPRALMGRLPAPTLIRVKRIVILGSTGSVGTQALDVIERATSSRSSRWPPAAPSSAARSRRSPRRGPRSRSPTRRPPRGRRRRGPGERCSRAPKGSSS